MQLSLLSAHVLRDALYARSRERSYVLVAALAAFAFIGCSDSSRRAPDADLPREQGPELALDEGQDQGRTALTPGFQRVEAGSATLGSPASEPCREAINETQWNVTITRAFEIAETEVTEGEYSRLVATARDPIDDCGDACPVNLVSWHEGAAYCNALSDEGGFERCYTCDGAQDATRCTDSPTYAGEAIVDCPGFRLPTEAEWEFAYRAGTASMTPYGDFAPSACSECGPDAGAVDDGVVSCHNSEVDRAPCRDLSFFGGPACAGRQPVASGAPNASGLYDMGGNLDEWCHDVYVIDATSLRERDPVGLSDRFGTTDTRTVRGASWSVPRARARAASRAGANGIQRLEERGFRCVRTL
ncbi:MAG: SUMF1/EgtB/PvdO family nonheme iron enzyme [Myxococcota bacterium]